MKKSFLKAVYILLPLFLYYVVHDVVRLLLMFVLHFVAEGSTSIYELVVRYDTVFSVIISSLCMFAGVGALIFLMKRDLDELAIADYVNLNGIAFYRADKIHNAYISWIVIAIQAISASLALNILLYLSGITKASVEYSNVSASQYSIPVWIGIIYYGIVSPLAEELLFRVVLFGRMKRCFPYAISVLVSGLFFGLYHRNIVQGIYGTLMGILMCLACEYLHTVWGAFALHSVANLTIYLLGAAGVLENLGNAICGIMFTVVAAVTIFFELYYSYKTKKEIGIPYGVTRVGCFFVDES